MDRHGVSVRMVPFAAGGGMMSAFTILDFPIAPFRRHPVEPSLVYVETLTGALYLGKAGEVQPYGH